LLQHSLHCYSKLPVIITNAMKKIIQIALYSGLLLVFSLPTSAQQSNDKLSRSELKKNIKACSEVIALNPANENAFYLRGNTKYLLKDYKGAVTDYNRAIELNPENRMAYYNRGFANTKLGNKIASRADFSKAAELGIKESADLDTSSPE
jgi:tetratricopeptide (TPR) repeat protein